MKEENRAKYEHEACKCHNCCPHASTGKIKNFGSKSGLLGAINMKETLAFSLHIAPNPGTPSNTQHIIITQVLCSAP